MVSAKEIAFEIRELGIFMRRKIVKMQGSKLDEFTGLHTWLVHYLFENRDKDMFQKDIEEMFSIRRSTATNLLQGMEKSNMIKRVSVSYDARLKKIILTQKALDLHEQMEKNILKFENVLAQGLTESEIEQFLCTLKKIKNNIR